MRIAQIAPLYESVPPRFYGGTERVVSWLTEELVRRGHDVTLFATGDSRTSARLVAPYPRGLRLDPSEPDATALHVTEVGQAFARAHEFDVIHSHVDAFAFPSGRFVRTPVVHTLHGRLDVPSLVYLFGEFRDAPLVSISQSQRAPLAALGVNWIETVYHGLPVDEIPFRAEPDRYLAFCGRVSPEKGLATAIAVARRVGLPLRIAAKIDEPDRAYFDAELAPLLEDPLIDFVGEIHDDEKVDFFGGALCLLFPIDWPEPFGLVMIEALACGTPVIARPCGSVREVIRDGVTGFVGDTIEELARAIKRVDLIERARCRADVEERFSVDAMANRYEAVYHRLQS